MNRINKLARVLAATILITLFASFFQMASAQDVQVAQVAQDAPDVQVAQDVQEAQDAQEAQVILLDDFESYDDGALPLKWKYLHDKKLVWLAPEHMRPNERFTVVEEDGNKALRVHVLGEAVHLTMANEEDGFDWDLTSHPRLAWDWRAISLPENAREDKKNLNDTGAGLYVIYKFEGFIIKKPKAIKYVYSSTLPVGTVVSYGKLKVIVVSTAADGIGEWQHIERDVVADYREVFGGDPPDRPLSIRLWGDSDNTGSLAEADFDNIRLLPPK